MSKTTQKYGQPLYTLRLEVQADVEPSNALLRNWIKLDAYSNAVYNKPYDALTDKQKSQLHFGINSGEIKLQNEK